MRVNSDFLGDAFGAALTKSPAVDVVLADITRWQIGGTARYLVEPSTVAEAQSALALIARSSRRSLIVGETSNLLFDDAGFDGILVRIGAALSLVEFSAARVVAQAGVGVPELARMTANQGLTGLEHTVGIPGTLGGLVTMNGGSQRHGIGENVVSVLCVDEAGELVRLSREECGFAYRTSRMQGTDLTVVEVELELNVGDPEAIHAKMDAIVAERAVKFPLDLPSCGSTFLSDPEMYSRIGPPGRAIEEAGLKGLSRGNAAISERHANFIVNLGGATSDDVLWLISYVQFRVEQETGFRMRTEVRYVEPRGGVVPADEAARRRWPVSAFAAL